MEVERALNGLELWISNNGYAGYDPYDIRGQERFVSLFGKQSVFYHKLRNILHLVERNLHPLKLRKILKIKKEINAKGMGLFASAYLSLYSATGRQEYLNKAEDVLDWLAKNTSKGYPGMSWGYPFHWQSRIFIPKGTPSVVVTGIVGDAWLDHYLATASPSSLACAKEIASFMVNGLNVYNKSADMICFSYTPLDQFKVHNANLFAAAFLARLGKLINNKNYIELALKAVRFTLSDQNDDGSFYYWGLEAPSKIDHYHTGFVLRHLDMVHMISGEDFILKPLKSGFDFYLHNMFNGDNIPKNVPESIYPIDIHSCSEAILTLCQLAPAFGGGDKLDNIFNFIMSRMHSEEGYFLAEIRKGSFGERTIDIPYMRWGQAWMLLALAKLLIFINTKEDKVAHSI